MVTRRNGQEDIDEIDDDARAWLAQVTAHAATKHAAKALSHLMSGSTGVPPELQSVAGAVSQRAEALARLARGAHVSQILRVVHHHDQQRFRELLRKFAKRRRWQIWAELVPWWRELGTAGGRDAGEALRQLRRWAEIEPENDLAAVPGAPEAYADVAVAVQGGDPDRLLATFLVDEKLPVVTRQQIVEHHAERRADAADGPSGLLTLPYGLGLLAADAALDPTSRGWALTLLACHSIWEWDLSARAAEFREQMRDWLVAAADAGIGVIDAVVALRHAPPPAVEQFRERGKVFD